MAGDQEELQVIAICWNGLIRVICANPRSFLGFLQLPIYQITQLPNQNDPIKRKRALGGKI
jgi:hypothetical protein